MAILGSVLAGVDVDGTVAGSSGVLYPSETLLPSGTLFPGGALLAVGASLRVAAVLGESSDMASSVLGGSAGQVSVSGASSHPASAIVGAVVVRGSVGPVVAPSAPFAVGTEVGVPTGTVLTDTPNLPAADATENVDLTHPISGAENTVSASVWRRRRFTGSPTIRPLAGATYLFDECKFECDDQFWACEVDGVNGTNDQMVPLVVFQNCTFDGNNSTGKAITADHVWLMNCHASDAEDAFFGGRYSVIQDSNLIAADNENNVDPHSDGFQCAETGHTTLYHNWCSAGTGPGSSQAVRFGTEFGATSNIQVYYCAIDDGGWAMQFRGDSGAGDISTVDVQGCRWQDNHEFGPIDVEETTGITWTDNKLINGTVIPSP